MKTPMYAAVTLALLAAACGDSNEPSPVFSYTADDAFFPVEDGIYYPGDALTVSGHLEGTLRGVTLSADTTENQGSFSDYEGSPTSLYASIAARGEGGAGMLIINLTETGLREKLLAGEWSLASGGYTEGSSVSSCAGPVIGDWPYELGATDYEMEASEDPAQPGIVVLAVKAHFPRSESDASSTTELTGTLRFELPAASD
jgi:hypothetical protein